MGTKAIHILIWLCSLLTIHRSIAVRELLLQAEKSGLGMVYSVKVYPGVDQAFVAALTILWIVERVRQQTQSAAAAGAAGSWSMIHSIGDIVTSDVIFFRLQYSIILALYIAALDFKQSDCNRLWGESGQIYFRNNFIRRVIEQLAWSEGNFAPFWIEEELELTQRTETWPTLAKAFDIRRKKLDKQSRIITYETKATESRYSFSLTHKARSAGSLELH